MKMHCAFSPEVYLRKKWWALLLPVIGLAGLVLGIAGEDELIVMAAAVLFVVPLCRVGHCLIYRKKDYIELQPQCVTVFQLRDSWIKTDRYPQGERSADHTRAHNGRGRVRRVSLSARYGAAAASADAGEPDRFYALLRSRRSDLREIRKHEKGIRLWRLN
jgi:hypothetical protein